MTLDELKKIILSLPAEYMQCPVFIRYNSDGLLAGLHCDKITVVTIVDNVISSDNGKACTLNSPDHKIIITGKE